MTDYQLPDTRPKAAGGPVEVAESYLQAWNDHDGAAVARLFAPNGTYIDPTLRGPLSGDAIATYDSITMTWIDVDSEQEWGEVGFRTSSIIEALSSEPGFIGWVGASPNHRGHTLTAWTTPEAAEAAIARAVPHREAMARFMHHGLGARAFTSLWIPYRLNAQIGTCPGCGHRVSIASSAQVAHCECGGEVAVTSYI